MSLLSSLAFILGPLWGGGALPWLQVLFALPLVLLVVALALFVDSYKKMLPHSTQPAQQSDQSRQSEEEEGERAPLLEPSQVNA